MSKNMKTVVQLKLVQKFYLLERAHELLDKKREMIRSYLRVITSCNIMGDKLLPNFGAKFQR